MTSAIFDVFQILPTESDVIKHFGKFLTNLSELLLYITRQSLVLIALRELKLSPFFDYDVIETDCVT